MKDRKLVGISQYNYLGGVVYPEIIHYADTVQWAIREQFFPYFCKICHLPNVVFDVIVWVRTQGNERISEVKLLEINPFFEMTDPCLFDWANEFDGSFKYNLKGGNHADN